MHWLTWACCLLTAAGMEGAPEVNLGARVGQLCGPADVSAMTGNGALTVGANRFGRVSVCRWPSPSYCNQVRYRTRSVDLPSLGVEPGCGLMWGVRVNGETQWLDSAPTEPVQRYAGGETTVIETVLPLAESDATATQELFVHPVKDILVARIEVRGLTQRPEVCWFANFSPCTRVLPELPIGDWLLNFCNDFAVFSPDRGRTIHHFRPRQPGASAWAEALELGARAAPTGRHPLFEDGVWIVYASGQDVAGFQCGREDDASSAFVQAGVGRLAGFPAACGQCDSAMALVPSPEGDVYTATVLTAFGSNQDETTAALDYAMERGYAVLLRETEEYWRERLAPAILPACNDPAVVARSRRDLLTIIQCMDRNTGAIVRSPTPQPPLVLDWPRHGAWITWALDLAGRRDLAEKHTLFYCEAVRAKGKRAKPYGSVPAALYANHVEGLPHVIVEADAAAWVLGSFWRHACFLNGPPRRAYLNKVWDAAGRAADFLAGWTDGRTREPLHSFNPLHCRDMKSAGLLLTTYMGLDSALRIARALGRKEPPEWLRRRTELGVLILLPYLDEGRAHKADAMLPFWQDWQQEIAETVVPTWDEIIEQRPANREGCSALETARLLCDAAMVWHQRPVKLATLKPLLTTAFERTAPPDSLIAALELIAASLVYPANS